MEMNCDNPFIKHDNGAKKKASLVTTIISMVLDVLLAVAKIICGVLYGAISVIADGLNNLSDGGSLIINVIGIQVAEKPADKEHPYGHARGEYVAAMAIAFIICFLAFETFIESIDKIIAKERSDSSLIMIIVIAVGICVKLCMFVYNRIVGKRLSSQILLATSADSLGDVLASSAVLVSLIVSRYASVELDGYAGILIAVIIAFSGVGVIRKTSSELLGKSPSREVIAEISRRLLSYEGIYGIHGLTVHSYVNKYFASVHAEIDADIPVLTAHELIDKIEKDFERDTDIILTIHLDPVILHDSETNLLHAKVEELIRSVDPSLALHDFREIRRELPLLVFEVGVPFDSKLSNDKILSAIYERLYDEFGVKYEYSVDIKRELTLSSNRD